jgi:hypothetical protein
VSVVVELVDQQGHLQVSTSGRQHSDHWQLTKVGRS